MRSSVAFAAVAWVLLAAHSSRAEEGPKKFEGTWGIESITFRGKKQSGEEFKTKKIVLTSTKIRFLDDGKESEPATLILDETASPKHFDTDDGKNLELGIYKVEGETLTICFGSVGEKRPDEFESKEGTKTTLVVLKRETPK